MSVGIDKVIASIRSLYLKVFSFVVVFTYVAVTLCVHNQKSSDLVALDQLPGLRYVVTTPSSFKSRNATQLDLTRFFQRVGDDYLNAILKLAPKVVDEDVESAVKKLPDSPKKAEPPEKPDPQKNSPAEYLAQWGNRSIDGAMILEDVPMRLAVGATCDALISQFKPGVTFSLMFHGSGGMVVLNSENARLVTFGSCNPGEPKEINAFSFALSDGSFVFVVPKELVQTFPGFQPRPIDSFDHIDDIQNLLPEVVAKSATFNQEFVMLNLRTMDYFILAYANARLGKFFAADQMPAAIDRLYEKNKEQQASYFGITAASSLLVRFGPLVYFALSFELWRRLRLLPVRKIRSTEYWFVFETRDWIGYIYAILCAVAPVLFGILIYVLFAVAQDLSVFGHIVTLGGIIRLDFPQAPPSGWIGYDNISSIVELVGVPFHFIVLTLISTKLMRLIRANRAQV